MNAAWWMPDARILGLAVLIDLALGDPPNALHPVAWLGRIAGWLLRRAPGQGPRRQLVAGAVLVALVVGIAVMVAWAVALACAAKGAPRGLGLVGGALFLKSTFALRGLGLALQRVTDRWRAGDLAGARIALHSLCSRDASALDGAQLAAAAVESVAENTSDSVVAPLLFYALFGLPGAAFYRAANTLDAMIGYHGRFEYLGKVAARLDDVLNFVPARLTAMLLLGAGFFRGADVAGGLRILRRDGDKTESPNAGRPMSAMAGLLGVVLGKVDHYRLGDEGHAIEPGDMEAAWRFCRDAALGGASLAMATIGLRATQGWGW